MKAAELVSLMIGAALLLTACSGGQASGSDQPTRQVTSEVGCADAQAYTELALTIPFAGKQVWDAAREKGEALLAEEAPDADVTAAMHDIASSGIALADATEELAADPAVKAALAKADPAAAAPLAQPMEAVTTAGDRVSDTC